MPRMPNYIKREWAFFLDERGHSHTNRTAGGYHWEYVEPDE